MADGDNQNISYKGFKWTIGNEDVPALALVVDNYSKQLHICEPADVGTDWAVAVATNPTVYIHSATNPATEYLSLYHDATNAYIDGVGATLISLQIAGVTKLSVSATVVDCGAMCSADAYTVGTTAGTDATYASTVSGITVVKGIVTSVTGT